MKALWLMIKPLANKKRMSTLPKKLVVIVSTLFFIFSVAFSTAVTAKDQVIDTVKTEPTKVTAANTSLANSPSVNSPSAESLTENLPPKNDIYQPSPQVGRHVGGNMDAMSMILSLLMVLALIVLIAFILKRIQPGRFEQKDLKIVTRLALGAKESLVVVQVGDKQQLLGVTSGQITLLETLEHPIKVSKSSLSKVDGIAQSLVSFLQKPSNKIQQNSKDNIKNGASSLSQFKNQQL